MDFIASLTRFIAQLSRLESKRPAGRVAICLLLLLGSEGANAQVPQLRSGTATPIQGGVSANAGAPVGIPRTNLAPIDASGFGAPAGGSSQLLDPYAIQGGATPPAPGAFAPSAITPSPPGSSLFSRIFSRPAAAPMAPGLGTTGSAPPTFYTGPPVINAPPPGGLGINGGLGTESIYNTQPYGTQPYAGSPGFAQPSYPNTIYPSSTPSTLFPGGLFSGADQWMTGTGVGATAYRLFQGPRLQHTFVHADDSRFSDVETNDTDISLVFAVPRFLYSSQPLFIIPSFSLHLWDGPNGAIGADLPPSAYSAFLDFGWESNPNQMIGTEFGMRLGVFTDFDTYNSRSFRTLGKALVHFRLSPASTLRGGVYYLDRNRVKLVPAAGILWQPDPFTRFDFFFPQPKLSRYWRTIGTRDVWWYIAGDYGGGSWTITRTNGTEDSIDINEIRVLFGLEWGFNDALRMGRRNAFFEIGYAFDREVRYRQSPQHNFDTHDALLFRVGIGY